MRRILYPSENLVLVYRDTISVAIADDSVSVDALLKLLKNARDQNRLAGLSMLALICKNEEVDGSLYRIYKKAGAEHFDFLLRTGLGKESTSSAAAAFQYQYLRLAIQVIAGFCRFRKIASSEEMISKIPLILEAMTLEPCAEVIGECYQFLFLVSRASDAGAMKFYESGGMDVLVDQMHALPEGALNLAIKLIELIINKMSDSPSKLLPLMPSMARQFAIVRIDLKFGLLKLICTALSHIPEPLEVQGDNWPGYVHVGVFAVLGKPAEAGRDERVQALTVAKLLMILIGDEWLIDQVDLPDVEEVLPPNRSLSLILECSRTELHVLLSEIAFLKHQANSRTQSMDTMQLKLRSLETCFYLVERIIILIPNFRCIEGLDDTGISGESAFGKFISDLNETAGVLLVYLQNAKRSKRKRGDDLIESVRFIGMWIARASAAIRCKVTELFEYMLSVEGRDKSGPWSYTWFVLPILREITKDDDGCKALVSRGGHKAVMRYLVQLIAATKVHGIGWGCDSLVFNTVVNILLKRKQLRVRLDESTTIDLLVAIGHWAEHTKESSDTMKASCLCALLFHFTSEKNLVRHPKFDKNAQELGFRLVEVGLTRSFAKFEKEAVSAEEMREGHHLQKIIVAAYNQWSRRFPSIKDSVERQPTAP
uniref:Neurochondrin-like protein n=1 Tax=Kalanchoe fedtschenkoi TaxID=63787 RepID=A0A7N0SV71_KALFE